MNKTGAAKSTPSVSGGRKVNRVALLEKVAELGSITAAAKAVGVSCQDACALIKASHIFLAVNS